MSPADGPNWIDRVLEKQAVIDKNADVIVAHVGRAENVAIGKNIHQVITQVLGAQRPDDAAEVRRGLAELRREFDRLTPLLTEKQKYLGADKLQTIESELQKEDQPPSGDLIRSAGSWLVEQIPQMGQALISLFLPESVGRVLANSGSAVIEWIRSLTHSFSG